MKSTADLNTLFKFRQINKFFLDSLVRPSLYFSAPHRFNDPFDCRVNLRRIIERAAKVAGPDRTAGLSRVLASTAPDEWGKIFHKIGVCSFSVSAKHVLMWSHYADNHRGVCIAYTIPDSFIEDTRATLILGRESVHYGSADFINFMATASVKDRDEFLQRLIPLYVTTKHKCWKYEDEVRIVRGDEGLLDIPPEFVRQICFGLEAPTSDIELVSTLAKAYLPKAALTKMVRTRGEFGLRMVPL